MESYSLGGHSYGLSHETVITSQLIVTTSSLNAIPANQTQFSFNIRHRLSNWFLDFPTFASKTGFCFHFYYSLFKKPVKYKMICQFQVVFVLYFSRLVIYFHNLYQDIHSLAEYINDANYLDHTLVIMISLLAPTVLNVIYLVIKAILYEQDTGCRNLSQKFIEGLLLILFQLKKYQYDCDPIWLTRWC